MTHTEIIHPLLLFQPNLLQFPYSPPLERMIIPTWVFISLILTFMVLAWIRVIYTRFMMMNFKAAFNYQLSLQLYKDSNQVQKQISRIMLLVYFISISLFTWLIFFKKEISLQGFTGIYQLLLIAGFFAGMNLLRTMMMSLTGHIFDRYALFSASLFQQQLYNKLLGISLLPLTFLYAYSSGLLQEVTMYLGLLTLTIVYLFRITRQIIFIYKNVVLLFYLILYLCCLEILPFLVIFKLIISLIPVP